ncbi:glycosyltransferase family 4 protein [Sphingomonas sp. NSE70-1]|uniref:Glycosyltransferase family 4 protein n=1 Tax=Sphingomonas caseinilyticus TaxID=2908205 RepID=A0ABT0RQR6_9SPHN|nr:glycosyltransferase family 4 protein [Sphingomonas caseinilyticus]
MRTTSGARPAIILSANSFWNVANFRAGLLKALAAEGFRIVIAAPQPDEEWAARHGASTNPISIDRSGLNPFRDALLFFEYLKLIRRVRPAAFIGFTAKPNIYGSLAAVICGVPSLPNVSGLGTAFIKPGPLSVIVGTLYRLAFRNCPIVFFQNPDDSELFIQRGIVRREQVRILPGSGVDLAHFSPAPTPDAIRFLFVGRLLGDKGVREFVEAARLVRQDHPDWIFQLLGPLDEDNRSAIQRAELDQWLADGTVEYLGAVDDVRPHIAAATAIVLPSYREGLSRSLLEAAAMARPLIATDVPGNRHIVSDGNNGLLCAVRKPLSLASAIRKMGQMASGEREAMGQSGRAIVEREFSEAKVTSAYSEALAQLCNRPRS